MTSKTTRVSTWFWLSACVGSAGMLWLSLSDQFPLTTEVTAAAAPRLDLPVIEPASYQPPPLQAFDEIAARPLFATDRRPYVPPPEEPDASPEVVEAAIEPPPAELVGVMLSDSGHSALFERDSDGRASWVYQGQALEGWVVDTIEAGHAILRRGDLEARLSLRPD